MESIVILLEELGHACCDNLSFALNLRDDSVLVSIGGLGFLLNIS